MLLPATVPQAVTYPPGMQSIQAGHAWIAWAVVLPVLLLYLGRTRRLSAGHLLAVATFGSYLVVVSSFTILPFRLDDEYLSGLPFDPVSSCLSRSSWADPDGIDAGVARVTCSVGQEGDDQADSEPNEWGDQPDA